MHRYVICVKNIMSLYDLFLSRFVVVLGRERTRTPGDGRSNGSAFGEVLGLVHNASALS